MSKAVSPTWKRLVRFRPKSASHFVRSLIGQPLRDDVDVGLSLREGKDVEVQVFSGSSMLDPGTPTSATAEIDRLYSPLSQSEVGTLRCIGLNYKQHAAEVNMVLPTVPALFMKPATSLSHPWPEPISLPKLTQLDDSGDYEAELAVVIGKPAKNVSEANSMEYVLGYTAANDVSSRTVQFAQSQWGFSKGFDASCPLGPTLVSPELIPDPSRLRVRGILNGKIMQDCGTDDMIFSIPQLISFLSQSTTLPAGTVILTGTPAGVGTVRKPKVTIRQGDEFQVNISPFIGTLVSVFKNEK